MLEVINIILKFWTLESDESHLLLQKYTELFRFTHQNLQKGYKII